MNRKIKTQILAIMAVLGFKTKAERDAMTNADWNRFNTEYRAKYGRTLQEDIDAEEGEEDDPPEPGAQGAQGTAPPDPSPEMQASIRAALEDAAEASGQEPPASAPATNAEAVQSFMTALASTTQTIRTLGATPESSGPAATVSGSQMTPRVLSMVTGHAPHTQTHLFGHRLTIFSSALTFPPSRSR
jgi:hypothetical protein